MLVKEGRWGFMSKHNLSNLGSTTRSGLSTYKEKLEGHLRILNFECNVILFIF